MVHKASKQKVIFDYKTGEIIDIKDKKIMDSLLAASNARVIYDNDGNILDIKDVGILDAIVNAQGIDATTLPNLRAAYDENGQVQRIMDREAMVQSGTWVYPPAFGGGPRYIHDEQGSTMQIMDFNNFDQVHAYGQELQHTRDVRAGNPAYNGLSIFDPLPTPHNAGIIDPLPQHRRTGANLDGLTFTVFGLMSMYFLFIAFLVMVYQNRDTVK